MIRYVIIVAGGKGSRMASDVPKQFLPLCGRPVLMYTIEAFFHFDKSMKIIVVLPEEQQDYWKGLCDQYDFSIPHQVIQGGTSRFYSVKNGLSLVEGEAVIGIHDGVRPLIPLETIAHCYDVAASKGMAFPVVPVIDTLRQSTGNTSVLVDRNNYFQVQTPQVFRSEIIRKAYEQPFSEIFTDDVSVVEALGECPITHVEGNRRNIKITTPEDLAIASALLRL